MQNEFPPEKGIWWDNEIMIECNFYQIGGIIIKQIADYKLQ